MCLYQEPLFSYSRCACRSDRAKIYALVAKPPVFIPIIYTAVTHVDKQILTKVINDKYAKVFVTIRCSGCLTPNHHGPMCQRPNLAPAVPLSREPNTYLIGSPTTEPPPFPASDPKRFAVTERWGLMLRFYSYIFRYGCARGSRRTKWYSYYHFLFQYLLVTYSWSLASAAVMLPPRLAAPLNVTKSFTTAPCASVCNCGVPMSHW